MDERILSLASIQIHDAGTMVEAAVTAVVSDMMMSLRELCDQPSFSSLEMISIVVALATGKN